MFEDYNKFTSKKTFNMIIMLCVSMTMPVKCVAQQSDLMFISERLEFFACAGK